MLADFVYPLSPGPADYSELRYSLRSLDRNTVAERVHFFGGRPSWLTTGMYAKTMQPYDKLRNARIQMRAALDSDEVSDPFWWLNDDMFFMRRIEEPPLWHGGEFEKWLTDLGPRYANSQYMKNARLTIEALHGSVRDPLCWSLHTPILTFKASMREALAIDSSYDQKLHLRTLYGNLEGLLGVKAPVHDVKTVTAAPDDATYASSSNATWAKGALGQQIRAMFPNLSRWER